MERIDLEQLHNHLKKTNKEFIYLTLSEIEGIIGAKLPQRAYTSPKWWSNDARFKKANYWLSADYKTCEINNIPLRHGVIFRKFEKNGAFKKIIYNRHVVSIMSLFVIPVVVAFLGTYLFFLVSENITFNNKIYQIEHSYLMKDYKLADTLINEVRPLLENKKMYRRLCRIEDIEFNILFGDELPNSPLEDDKFHIILRTCERGLEYAERGNNLYYKMLFLNNSGEVYFFQYCRTFDDSYLEAAKTRIESADKIYELYPPELIPKNVDRVLTDDEISMMSESIKSNIYLFDIYYIIASSDRIDPKKLDILSDDSVMLYQLYYTGRAVEINGDYQNQIKKRGGIMDVAAWLTAKDTLCRFLTSYYLVSKKYNLNYFEGDDEVFGIDALSKSLIELTTVTKQLKMYDMLAYEYYELSRLFYNHFILVDQDPQYIIESNKYLELFQEIRQPIFTMREIDMFYCEITDGEMLDMYIESMEKYLNSTSFLNNPSLYAYSNYELGKHYFYKLSDESLSADQRSEIASKAIECLNLALVYYDDEQNSYIHNEIIKTLNDIDELE